MYIRECKDSLREGYAYLAGRSSGRRSDSNFAQRQFTPRYRIVAIGKS